MSDTRNECRIVNELSETIEAELSEAVEELESEIVEKATIDDSEAGLTTTYSSEKIEDLIDSIPGGVEIDDTVTSETKTWSSNKINTEVEAVETIANSKATIDDSEASQATTYSSNKIEDLIDNIPTGAQIDDSEASLTTTFSSQLIGDLIVNTDKYYKEYTGNFSRVENTLQTIATIPLSDKMLVGFGIKFNQKDSFSTTTTDTLEVQFVGNNSGTVYFTKQYTGSEAFPEGGSAHINITDTFTVDEVDPSDTSIIYKFRCVNAYWTTNCPYVIDIVAPQLIGLLN